MLVLLPSLMLPGLQKCRSADDQAGALPQEGGQVDRGGVIRTWCGAAIASSWQTTSNETCFDLRESFLFNYLFYLCEDN